MTNGGRWAEAEYKGARRQREQDSGLRPQDSGRGTQATGLRPPDSGHRTQAAGAGFRTQASGLRTQDEVSAGQHLRPAPLPPPLSGRGGGGLGSAIYYLLNCNVTLRDLLEQMYFCYD
jgi:hypothetical protein